jgi:hypothetical protein
MKQTFNARIVGHEIFTPDTKEPTFQLARVKFEIQPGSERMQKTTKGVLAIQLERLDEYPLRGFFRITLEDSQQVLDLLGAPHKPSKPGSPQLSITPPGKGGRGKGRTTPKDPDDQPHAH